MIWSAMGSLISPIWQEFLYLWNYNSNIKQLEDKVKDLESKEVVVKEWEGISRDKGINIGNDVTRWFENVITEKEKANEVLKCTENTQMGCLFIECPNLYSRYTLSKEALNMTTKLRKLEKANFLRFGYLAPEQIPFTSPKTFESFESRTKIMNDVLQALKNDSITTIGICGMPGVGKTTLVNKIADDVRANKSFDKVVVAVVSKNPMKEVQNQLAGCLGLEWGENLTGKARKDRLYTRLKDGNEKILIILDDLWQELEPHKIGFLERERLKVLFTSRVREICNNMSAKLFEVKVLSKEEAWDLFKKTVEFSQGAIDEDIAREVAKECGGLPLAIRVVGTSLKNKKEYVWRDALQQLKKASAGTSIRGMEDLVYSRIKWSYDYLENVHSKKLLILCSLFPEDYDIPVECLAMYVKGLQLFQNVETIAQARDRVCTIIDELKSCYLLLESEDEEHVKLHGVVRDVCLSIASSSEQAYSHISLTFDRTYSQIPSGLECLKLKFIRLISQEEQLRARMPEDFFQMMKELEVLELAKMNGEVPSSLKLLLNLRTLLIIDCRLNGDISVIRSLEQLEILSFRRSCFESFSNNNMELGNLKFLDLRVNEGAPIPFDFLVSLKKLEELYLGNSDSKHLVDADKMTSTSGVFLNLEKLVIEEAKNLEELCHGNLPRESFAKLREVQLRKLPLLRHLGGGVFLNLEKLVIEEARNLEDLCHGNLSHGSFAKLREVQLRKLPTLHHFWGTVQHPSLGNHTSDDEEKFPKLQHLKLESLRSFKGFGPGIEGALFKKDILANLETLDICDMEGIKRIVDNQTPIGSLSKLQDMKVQGCDNLLHVATANSIKLFQSLERLCISQCRSLKAIFHFEGLNVGEAPHPLVGCLQFLKLEGLDELEHIWKMLPEGIHAFNNLRELSVWRCPDLKYLISPSMAKVLVGLETLDIRGCDSMKVIFGMEETSGPNSSYKIELPKLKLITTDEEKLCSQNIDQSFLQDVEIWSVDSNH